MKDETGTLANKLARFLLSYQTWLEIIGIVNEYR